MQLLHTCTYKSSCIHKSCTSERDAIETIEVHCKILYMFMLAVHKIYHTETNHKLYLILLLKVS